MKGLMQDAPLMISSLIQIGADVYGGSEVVSVVASEGVVRHTYKEINQRAKKLAQALQSAGIGISWAACSQEVSSLVVALALAQRQRLRRRQHASCVQHLARCR